MNNSLSQVMKQLRASVEATKNAVLAVAKDKRDRQVAEYAGETVVLLGELESAMETAEGRLDQLEKAGAFERKPAAAKKPAVPLLRREEEEEEEPATYDGPPLVVDEIADDSRPVEDEALDGEAITAILQYVEACRNHEEAEKELQTCLVDMTTVKPGQKCEVSIRLAKAQAAIVETWTAKKETYALQELLADRGPSV